MATSIVKRVSSSFLTPVKTSKLNLVPSPFEKKSLSAISVRSNVANPKFLSFSSYCKTHKEKNNSFSSDKRSPQQYNAVRCLFSSQRSPKIPISKRLCQQEDIEDGKDLKVPSFDTPLRNSISSKKLNKEIHGFILGRGSFGLVVKGRYKNKIIAVKVISQCRESAEMLKSEMNALKLKHSHIIQVFQVIVDPEKNLGFVFMELYSNRNLETFLQDELVYFSDKLRYLKQIGSALQYCHNNEVLHLDLKPKNIIVNSSEKTCKLCDFGSSINLANIKKTDNPRKGTLKYSAPELLKGENVSEKADVYSFGITMWQTIYQEVPYNKENLEEVAYKVVKYNYRPASTTPCNQMVHQIYVACWHANPAQRPSVSHVLNLIEEVKLL